MSADYFISSIAEQDIDEAITYLAKENPQAAHDFVDALYIAGELFKPICTENKI